MSSSRSARTVYCTQLRSFEIPGVLCARLEALVQSAVGLRTAHTSPGGGTVTVGYDSNRQPITYRDIDSNLVTLTYGGRVAGIEELRNP